MKLKHIFSLLAVMLLTLAACSPDDYGMGGAQYSSEDLVEGKAYTVTIEGNRVHLKSLITGCKPLWVTPNGRSQEEELTLEMPFSGDYEVTFGVDTRAGAVYGAPYKFNLAQNDFSLLNDEKWFYLTDASYKGGKLPSEETIKKGVKKRWYPVDADYSKKLGNNVNGPLAMMTPNDPDNDGQGFTDAEEENRVYKDIPFGRKNWSCNWGPGLTNDWFMLSDNAYLDSYMEFSLDAQKGCVATMYRGESGTKTVSERWKKSVSELSSTGTVMNGKFNLNLVDKDKPSISFSDCYLMHPASYDEVCSNYTQELQIIELTDYYMAVVAKRTNSEGNWYIVFHFISSETVEDNGENIPADPVLETALKPVLPEFPNLKTQMYTTDISGVSFVGNQLTYKIDAKNPYEILTWNGAYIDGNKTKVGRWQETINGNYKQNWAPACGDDIEDFELTVGHMTEKDPNGKNKNPKTYYTWNDGHNEGVFFIDNKGQTLSFTDVCKADDDGKIPNDFKPTKINFIHASNDTRTISINNSKFHVFAMDPEGGTMTIGVPDETSKNEDGQYTRYFAVNLKQKPVSGGTAGPTIVPFEASKVNNYIEAGKYLRCELYNPWPTPKGAVNPENIKVKNKQTISVTVELKGFTFTKDAKMVLCCNYGSEDGWEKDGCFDYSRTITVNKDGTYTLSWTNTTGQTASWADNKSALTVTMQYEGYASVPTDAEGSYKDAITVKSIAIQ